MPLTAMYDSQIPFFAVYLMLFAALIPVSSEGQPAYPDSLRSVLSTAIGKNRVSLLVSLGEHYKDIRPQQAKAYLGEALKLAGEHGMEAQKGMALKLMGIVLYNEGEYSQAMSRYEEAMAIFQKQKDSAQIVATWLNVGLSHNKLGNNALALEYSLNALETCQRQGYEFSMGYAYNQIGIVLQEMGQAEKAITYFRKSFALRTKINHQTGLAHTATNLGNYHLDTRRSDSARYYFDIAMRIHTQEGDSTRIADTFSNIGNIYYDENDFTEAERYYRKSLEIRLQYPNQAAIASSYNNLAYALIKQEKLEEAEACLNAALEKADSLKLNSLLASVHRTLAYLKESQGDLKETVRLLKRYQSYYAKDKNERIQTKIAELEVAYRLRQKEQQDAALREAQISADLARSQARLQFWLIGFLLCSVVLLVLFFQYRGRQKSRIIAVQEQKNQELKQLNASLDSFVYSVSHDLKAPINSSLGLIELMKLQQEIGPLQELIGLQERSLRRLDTFIFDILQFSRNTRTDIACEPVLLAGLVEEVFQQLSHNERARQVELLNHVPAGLSVCSDPSRLKVILSNLISNGVRYSNLYQAQPFVKVGAKRLESAFQLTVEDNGVGIADEHKPKIFNMFYRVGNHAESSGIGLFLVKETIEKLKGSIELESVPNRGTTFVINLPEQKATEAGSLPEQAKAPVGEVG